jgi:hypothetical protein
MAESTTSRKRAANTPLSSESDKKPRLELTDAEISKLNGAIYRWIAMFVDHDILSAADVTSNILATTLQQIAFALINSSSLDKSWLDLQEADKRINELPHDKLEDLKAAWVEARNKGWGDFADNGALLIPRPTHAVIKPHVVLLQGESPTVEPMYVRGHEDQEEGTFIVY